MSHAKNWIEYGFIGVNPSGERVSGTSSPLQFAIYACIYLFFHLEPFSYTLIQTIVCTFFLGYIFIKFFSGMRFALLYSVTGAFGLTRIYTFLGWHASGMENALIHVFYLWVVYILFSFVRTNKIDYYHSLVVFIATLGRYDSVYHIAPLLLIISIYWFIKNKSLAAFYFSLLVGSMWMAFMVGNYLYFGSVFPHTSSAQDINIVANIDSILSLDISYFKSRVYAVAMIVYRNGILLLPAFLAVVFLFDKKPIKSETKFIYIICYSLLLTGALNPLIFGPTRIDLARTTTFTSVIVMLFICLGISEIKFKKYIPHSIIFLVLVCIIASMYSIAAPQYYLGWRTDGFDNVRKQFLSAANENNIHRATVSNPDLGILSWYKQFNVVDLGMLGSPIITAIEPDERMARYYFDYIAPDLIETHGYWSEKYSFLWDSNFFKQRYTPVKVISYYKDDLMCPQGIWIRNDILKNSQSAERVFYDKLKNDLTLENIEQEFVLFGTNNSNSAYISRTIYKFIPELKAKDLLDDTIAILYKYNASKFDLYLLNGSRDATAWKQIADIFNSYETP